MIGATPHPPIIFVIIISTGVGVAIACVAGFLHGLNRPMAIMLAAISAEIGISIASDFVIDKPVAFATLKILGRLVEVVGVYLFFRYLVALRDQSRTVSDPLIASTK